MYNTNNKMFLCLDAITEICRYLHIYDNPLRLLSRQLMNVACQYSHVNVTSIFDYLLRETINDNIKYTIFNNVYVNASHVTVTLIKTQNTMTLVEYLKLKDMNQCLNEIKEHSITTGNFDLFKYVSDRQVRITKFDVRTMIKRDLYDIVKYLYDTNLNFLRLVRDNKQFIINTIVSLGKSEYAKLFKFQLNDRQYKCLDIPTNGTNLKDAIIRGDIKYIRSMSHINIEEVTQILRDIKMWISNDTLHCLVSLNLIDVQSLINYIDSTEQLFILSKLKYTKQDLLIPGIHYLVKQLLYYDSSMLNYALNDFDDVPWHIINQFKLEDKHIIQCVNRFIDRCKNYKPLRYCLFAETMIQSRVDKKNSETFVIKRGLYRHIFEPIIHTYIKGLVKQDEHELLSMILDTFSIPFEAFPKNIRSFHDSYVKSDRICYRYIAKHDMQYDSCDYSKCVKSIDDKIILDKMIQNNANINDIRKVYVASVLNEEYALQRYIESIYTDLCKTCTDTKYYNNKRINGKSGIQALCRLLAVPYIHRAIDFDFVYSYICNVNHETCTRIFFDYVKLYIKEDQQYFRKIFSQISNIPESISDEIYCLDIAHAYFDHNILCKQQLDNENIDPNITICSRYTYLFNINKNSNVKLSNNTKADTIRSINI